MGKAKKSSKAKKKPTMKKKNKTAALRKKTGNSKKKAKVIKKKSAKKGSKKVSAVPEGYHSITPYLIVNNASDAIDFYKKVFGAKEVMRMDQPSGKVGHAELRVGDAKFMIADEYPDMDARSPEAFGGTPVGIHLYIKNVDAVVEHSVNSGATLKRPPEDMFYGDRTATIEDPYGHKWYISTHVENVTPREMKKRAQALYSKQEKM